MNNFFLLIKDKKEFFDLLNEWEALKEPKMQVKNKETNEHYLSQREAAKFLRVSLPTLIAWKKARKVPFYQHGRKILFIQSEILEAIKSPTI
jgi:excisionase family DNA binding protein